MRFPILIIVLTASLSCKAQNYSSIVSDSLVETFMKSVLHEQAPYKTIFNKLPKKIYYKPIGMGSANWDIQKDTAFEVIFQALHKYDSILSSEDFGFIHKQYSGGLDSYWKFKSNKIRMKKKRRPRVFEYSIPLFTKDNKRAIFWRYYYRGPLHSYSELHMYKLSSGHWIVEYLVAGWMS